MDRISAALVADLCHCCAPGCDCGCIEDCRLQRHRDAAGLPTTPTTPNQEQPS